MTVSLHHSLHDCTCRLGYYPWWQEGLSIPTVVTTHFGPGMIEVTMHRCRPLCFFLQVIWGSLYWLCLFNLIDMHDNFKFSSYKSNETLQPGTIVNKQWLQNTNLHSIIPYRISLARVLSFLDDLKWTQARKTCYGALRHTPTIHIALCSE